MIKINFDIEKYKEKIGLLKYKNKYRVYKNTRTDHGIGSRKLFEGNYIECKNYCEENNIDLKEVITKL